MSGWYVRQLILTASDIRETMYESGTGFDEDDELETYEVINFDNDTYADLLSIEMTLNKLYKNGSIKREQFDFINYLLKGYYIVDAYTFLNKSEATATRWLSSVSSAIAEELGGHFTDEKFIENFTKKYNLNEEEIGKLNEYIRG